MTRSRPIVLALAAFASTLCGCSGNEAPPDPVPVDAATDAPAKADAGPDHAAPEAGAHEAGID